MNKDIELLIADYLESKGFGVKRVSIDREITNENIGIFQAAIQIHATNNPNLMSLLSKKSFREVMSDSKAD